MKTRQALFVSIILIAALYLTSQEIIEHSTPQETIVTKFDVHIVQSGFGLNADSDFFHFGALPPEKTSERWFDVTNNYPEARKVKFSASSEQREVNSWFTFVPKSGVVLAPYETKKITVQLRAPMGVIRQKYEGHIITALYPTWFWERSQLNETTPRELPEYFTRNPFTELTEH